MVDFHAGITQQLEPFASYIVGDPLASLVALKGRPGEAELNGGVPFCSADGLALDKAFGRLGWGFGTDDTRRWCGIVLVRPDKPPLSTQDIRLLCEIIDPLTIVSLDETARISLIGAFESAEEGFLADFTSGSQTWILGRHLVSVEDFEDSLVDEGTKQKAWAQLKRCTASKP
ncbi:MAG: hypothetical protein LBK67_00230 [Coriobacteriales bacterium]|jgi:hypothetical protein|nr:hypothetical protein [Coriobacteriales bacterium]